MAIDQPEEHPAAFLVTGENDPLLPEHLFSRMLRNTREKNHETLKQVAQRAGTNPSTLSRIENAGQRVPLMMVPGLLDAYGIIDEAQRTYASELIKGSTSDVWWSEFKSIIPPGLEPLLRLERLATRIRSLSTNGVEGLFQTRAYAEAINERTRLHAEGASARARSVDLRIARQRLLDRSVQLDVLLDEGVLRRVVGSPAVMREQLDHLYALSGRSTIDLRVLAREAGAYPGMFGHTWIVDSPGQRIVYCEGPTANTYLGVSADVAVVEQMFDRATELALTPSASRDLIREIADKYGA